MAGEHSIVQYLVSVLLYHENVVSSRYAAVHLYPDQQIVRNEQKNARCTIIGVM
jgi:hypothetical protein